MNLTHYLNPRSILPYGPYYHQINKGGLLDILTNGELKPSEARMIAGGGLAVRAHTSAEVTQSNSKVVIEFRTDTAPRSGTTPWLAEWRIPEYSRLKIEVVAIHGVPRHEDLY